MKLIELINTIPEADILAECARLDEKNGETPYRYALKVLHRTPPMPADFAVLLEPFRDLDPEDDGLILNVSGVKEGDPVLYALEFTEWSVWLDAEVRVKDIDATPVQMVAQCLYEMTFISFDPEVIEEKFEEIEGQVEEIKEGRAELVPIDELLLKELNEDK